MKKILQNVLAVIFWIAVWHFVSVILDKSLILVSPFEVIKRLGTLVLEDDFYKTVLFSFSKIVLGFFLSLICATILACVASFVPIIKALMSPLTAVVKATPVASFIILVLICVSSSSLSTIISFLMVFPIIYANVLQGISQTDKSLKEMAKVFDLGVLRRLFYIYIPNVMPYFLPACAVSLGLCWKSGIAAEVIGIPRGSIGEKLYYTKIYLETADLFAWTFVIIILSIAFEKVFMLIVKRVNKALENCLNNPKPKLLEKNQNEKPLHFEVKNITKTFGGLKVLDNFSCEFKKGDITCIMGRSGCGKTTLLNIILGLEKYDNGEVSDGFSAKKGVVFQEDRLCVNLNAVANVALACPSKSVSDIKKALLETNLDEESLNKRVEELSGGMKRRIAIVRAMLSDSDYVVMDEPLKGLDEKTYFDTVNFIKENLNGRTLIMVTHSVEETEIFGGNVVKM